MTDAPTNEIAIGMKISDLAILPQEIRSVSCATNNPNAVEAAGTEDEGIEEGRREGAGGEEQSQGPGHAGKGV